MITIKKLNTVSELQKFVEFPFSLFKNNPYWAPPIISDELESFDPDKNPVFDHADAHFFIAYKDNRPVGRIAAILNWLEVEKQGKPKIRFGWFDAVDDLEVTRALLKKVENVGRKHQLQYIEGPVGFSNMDKAGMLVEGFDELNTMITWYGLPYYSTHFEQLGFEKAKEWVEFNIKIPGDGPFEKVERFANLILEKYNLKVVHFPANRRYWIMRMRCLI